MRLWDETGDIEQLDGDETSASLTGCIVRLARTAELFLRASLANESDASVRLDCREGIVCDLDRHERRRGEEGRLAHIWLTDEAEFHRLRTALALEVPQERRRRIQPTTPGIP